jgi:ABC-type multidrug transport system permease subunit
LLFDALVKPVRGKAVLVEPEEGSAAMFELAQLVYQLAATPIVEFNLYVSLLSPGAPLLHTVFSLVIIGSALLIGMQNMYFVGLGCFSSAFLTESPACCH